MRGSKTNLDIKINAKVVSFWHSFRNSVNSYVSTTVSIYTLSDLMFTFY